MLSSLIRWWDNIRYSIYAPVYVPLANLLTQRYRKIALGTLDYIPNAKILIIGVGSGIDIQFIPTHANITGIDISSIMVQKTIKNANKLDRLIFTKVMDAQKLDFEDNNFDIVIMHLIISVVSDPIRCFNEAFRTVKENGQIVIFDNLAINESKNILARLFNKLSRIFFTNLGINMNHLLIDKNCRVERFSQQDFLILKNFFIIAKIIKISNLLKVT
jgi:ubiquinone/menaquinone biosynthesis C-methylase UbiE